MSTTSKTKTNRFRMHEVQPEAYKAMFGLDKYLSNTGLDPIQKELIKIRVSQINGCSYCLNKHTQEARNLGETEQRLYLLCVWKEVDLFTEEEKAILALTEQITLISVDGVTDDVYEKVIGLFGEEKTAQLIMMIITFNAWTRIGVSLQMKP